MKNPTLTEWISIIYNIRKSSVIGATYTIFGMMWVGQDVRYKEALKEAEPKII